MALEEIPNVFLLRNGGRMVPLLTVGTAQASKELSRYRTDGIALLLLEGRHGNAMKSFVFWGRGRFPTLKDDRISDLIDFDS